MAACFIIQMADQPNGRGHHKKRKKGARSHFTRRKNDELIRQKENKERGACVSHPSSRQPLMPVNNSQNPTTDLEAVKTYIILPPHWQCYPDSDTLEYILLDKGEDGARHVTKSLRIHSNLTWEVMCWTHVVPPTCKVLAKYPQHLLADNSSQNIVKDVDCSVLCPGHPEEQFVSLCQERGGSMKSQRGRGDVVAYVDKTPGIDSTGKTFQSTVRRVDCDILCEKDGCYPKRCSSCQAHRKCSHSLNWPQSYSRSPMSSTC